jgi:hypothetical protein
MTEFKKYLERKIAKKIGTQAKDFDGHIFQTDLHVGTPFLEVLNNSAFIHKFINWRFDFKALCGTLEPDYELFRTYLELVIQDYVENKTPAYKLFYDDLMEYYLELLKYEKIDQAYLGHLIILSGKHAGIDIHTINTYDFAFCEEVIKMEQRPVDLQLMYLFITGHLSKSQIEYILAN